MHKPTIFIPWEYNNYIEEKSKRSDRGVINPAR
ncbi:hypothetical protein SAMN05421863_100292 [Nitrosomonas communis]|uniref:Uncharacterized protein n=1 Tax=Nitrosomonas communis TaxID=44574 RepID=A0A1I4JLC6_9PROT|nr:hypothetical protein SAMN05421863_100292 [Nitrosomonas communis]